jgi:LmbE family N-acetylglucosaminyl deacetylase
MSPRSVGDEGGVGSGDDGRGGELRDGDVVRMPVGAIGTERDDHRGTNRPDLEPAPPHAVSKLYYVAWPNAMWAAYREAIGALSATVDGIERQATPWPDWAITTIIDTSEMWPTVWRAVSCHESQVRAYQRLHDLLPEHHRALWGRQAFYRAFSRVNGGRARETDLFEGIGR